MGFEGVTTNVDGAIEKLESPQISFTKAGNMYIYVSSEEATNTVVFLNKKMT